MKNNRDLQPSGESPVRRGRPRGSVAKSSPESTSRLGSLLTQIETYQIQLSERNRQLLDTRNQLKESYARYDELYDLAPVGYISLDRQGRIVELNQKVARLLRFPATWLIEKPFIVFVAKHDVQNFLTYLGMSAKNNGRKTIEIDLAADGSFLPVQIATQAAYDYAGEDPQAHCRMSIIDLNDIRQTERELQESLENWRSLVQNAPDVIMTVDRDGKIVFVNRPLWGHPVGSLVKTNILDLMDAGERSLLRQCLNEAFRSGIRKACEVTRKNDWYAFSVAPIIHRIDGEDPEINAATLIIREISDQKRAEQSLRHSSEELREFTARLEAVREEERATVAREIHDELGQALTVLKLDLAWFKSKKPVSKKQASEKLDSVLDQVDEMIQRVRRIASELRPSILDDLGLVAAIEWQLSEFQKRTGIKCRLRMATQSLEVDRERSTAVFRIVQEALTNVLRHAEASLVRVDLAADGSLLKLTITDDGKGIDNVKASSTKSLGLLGMKERALRFGGEFSIESAPRKGTRLEVSMKMQDKDHD